MVWTIRRRKALGGIAKLAEELASGLSELDNLSRDELANRIDPNKIEALVGSLQFLRKATKDLAHEVQKIGRRRDLAEEQWIFELADVYENAFDRDASVSGLAAAPLIYGANSIVC